MANLGNYQAGKETLGEGFDPLPVGTYMAMIVESELKDNKAGTGDYIWAKWQIIDGEYKGRFLFSNTTYTHRSSKMAEEIGRKELNTIMAAIGLSQIQDTNQLNNAAMLIDVKVKNDDKYGAQNEIKNYYPADGNTQAPVNNQQHPSQDQQQAPTQNSQAQAQGDATPSWAS